MAHAILMAYNYTKIYLLLIWNSTLMGIPLCSILVVV